MRPFDMVLAGRLQGRIKGDGEIFPKSASISGLNRSETTVIAGAYAKLNGAQLCCGRSGGTLLVYQLCRFAVARLETLTGTGALEPGMRAQLLREQIRILLQMTPALSAGAVIISFLLLALAADTPAFLPALTWSAALYGMVLVGLRAWFRARSDSQITSTSRATLACLIHGILWGSLPVILIQEAQPWIALIASVGVVGVLCVSGFALLVLPQAVVALVVPAFAGVFWASLTVQPPAARNALLVLLCTSAIIAAAVSTRLVRRFARHLFVESKLQEQKNIISLLLREFGEHPSDWLWQLDAKGRIVSGSERFSNASG
jgi:hypothetical protein